MNKKKSYFFVLNVIFPLIMGFTIYLLHSNHNLMVYKWVEFIGHKINYTSMDSESFVSSYADYMPTWLRFSLADGLWMYAFTSSIFLIWLHKLNTFWLITPLLIGIGLEVSQFYELAPGTFDYADLFFLVLAYILALTSGSRWRIKCIETQFPLS